MLVIIIMMLRNRSQARHKALGVRWWALAFLMAIFAWTAHGALAASPSTVKRQTKAAKKVAVLSVKDKATTSRRKRQRTVADKLWSLNFTGIHSKGVYENTDPTSIFVLNASHEVTEKSRVSLTQAFSKLYVVNPGESEIKWADTKAQFHYQPSWDYLTLKYKITSELTLPLSDFSSDQGVTTKPAVSFSASKGFLKDTLSLGLSPFARYYVNQYTTTVTGTGKGGGRPLVKADLGMKAGVSYSILKSWGVSASAGWTHRIYEKLDVENINPQYSEANAPVHLYSFELGTSVQAFERVSFFASVGQESQAEQRGGIEIVAYDEVASYWSLGASLSF